jgi:hypothetical protein
MDQSTLIKIARLRTLAARQGKAFDVVRFVGDSQFANQVLTQVMDTDDEDLIVLGLQLMQALGLGTAAPAPAPAAVVPPPPARSPTAVAPEMPAKADRYIGRLR